jgi:hypothetical protein
MQGPSHHRLAVLLASTIATALALVSGPSALHAQSPAVSIDDVSVTEGNDGTKSTTFTVRLSGASATPVTVAYGTPSNGYLPGDVMVPWEGGPSYYGRWANGPSTDPNVFPIAVWLQQPTNAPAFRAVGINLFLGLWDGPSEAQLSTLAANGMPTFCSQNSVGLTSANRGMIKAWTQIDEPDNAQNNTEDPMPTADVVSAYNAMVAADPTRPVFLNLGQGAASDLWYGRGHRTNHPEDYPEYALGGDILAFDTYPMNVFPVPATDPDWKRAFHDAVSQNIWYVALGVDRLLDWSGHGKPVWAWLECTNIQGDSRYALTPTHVKAEVWMTIIHGARGIGYFSHHWNPFSETGLLEVDAMRLAIAEVNAQITALAPVLNTQSVANGVTVASSVAEVPVDTMVKRAGGYTYVFAVGMRPGGTTATFTLRGFSGALPVEVVGESRTVSASGGVFQDAFSSYAVHIYKIQNP